MANTPCQNGPRSRRRGAILILVLFVMVILSLLAVSFTYRAGLFRRTVLERVTMLRLRHHAASAAAIAMARLAAESNDFDHPAEPWRLHAPLPEDNWLADWNTDAAGRAAEYVTDYQVLDEEGKFNVLTASSEALRKLGMKEDQIACLFDWMDSDDVVRSEGAESAYYQALPRPHRCKNAPLESLEELLMVRGFAPGDYWGEDDDHDGQLDPCENDGPATAPADNADGVLQPGWVDLLTCQGDGRINLNTAPQSVLRTLPVTGQAVDQIIGYRQFDAGGDEDLESHAFRDPNDIRQLQGLTAADKDVLCLRGRFTSEHFRIFVCSRHPRTALQCRLEVLVKARKNARPEVLQWKFGS